MALKQLGRTQRQIAQALGRSPSTISRELRRNQEGDGYAAERAQRISDRRRREARKARKRIFELITWVEERLRGDWSPEQIAGSSLRKRYSAKLSFTCQGEGGRENVILWAKRFWGMLQGWELNDLNRPRVDILRFSNPNIAAP